MLKVTYNADDGDPQETVVDGIMFKSGEAVEVDPVAKAHLVEKFRANPWFDVDDGVNEDEEKKAEARAAKQKARRKK